ncbi:hypothetical protein ON010_g18411 [Phytophthora cinnamomi]|nr:hypothetical protein ON010_g18411 [Phytophthora cinnamomi]
MAAVASIVSVAAAGQTPYVPQARQAGRWSRREGAPPPPAVQVPPTPPPSQAEREDAHAHPRRADPTRRNRAAQQQAPTSARRTQLLQLESHGCRGSRTL